MVSTILMAVGIVFLWAHWLNAEMGGGQQRGAAGIPTSAPVVLVREPAETTPRATPYQLWGTPTPLPAATLFELREESPAVVSPEPVTQTPVAVVAVPTWTPSPVPTLTITPTPVPRTVMVQVRVYWPDDSPDWCLTWDDDTGVCRSSMYSGDDWRSLAGRAWACDIRWYGRELDVPGIGRARCLDVGETFVCNRDETLCVVGLVSRVPVAEENVIYAGYLYGDRGRFAPVG